ncbi:MAG TPA: glucose-6-phosphate isomerase [Thermoanaerobaculia bacterium]|nr:glucose-6-phosphate isomerase [Thermoanaerobaculia bacterium]
MTSEIEERQITSLGAYEGAVAETIRRIEQEGVVSRIWEKRSELWTSDPESKELIRNALGWLDVVSALHSRANELQGLADELREAFDHVVVLGMGGSSLCPEVFRRSFPPESGFPRLTVLDSTVPDTVRSLEQQLDLNRSLFIVASKSGTTTEPQMFFRYFFERVRELKGEDAGASFLAITDPGTELAREAESNRFRRTFLNPADIGGRYSALSYFGMVPAALAGIDVYTLLDRALRAADACTSTDVSRNPGARLGAILGTLARDGRDKLTLVASRPIDSLGLWIEQLVAESTGKEGKGILPVAGEPFLPLDRYGADRLFVSIRTVESDDLAADRHVRSLRDAGLPLVEHLLADPLELGAELFIWEFATAVAGALLGINPFDQPNVQESKDNTRRLLEEFKKKGALPEDSPLLVGEGMRFFAADATGLRIESPEDLMRSHLERAKPGDYVALTHYIEERDEHDRIIGEMRSAIAATLGVATTSGYGPRFLHSTGQLHKGGTAAGVFLQITRRDENDVAIPGEPFTFGVLKDAQAIGDFESLAARGRRALRVDLEGDTQRGLETLRDLVTAALSPMPG